MAKNDNLKDFLVDVADAIREKKGTTDKINPQDFSSEIASIQSGGRDWSEIGYDAEPSSIEEGFAYAKEIKDNWNSNIVTISNKWHSDNRLFIFPNVDFGFSICFILSFVLSAFIRIPLFWLLFHTFINEDKFQSFIPNLGSATFT